MGENNSEQKTIRQRYGKVCSKRELSRISGVSIKTVMEYLKLPEFKKYEVVIDGKYHPKYKVAAADHIRKRRDENIKKRDENFGKIAKEYIEKQKEKKRKPDWVLDEEE